MNEYKVKDINLADVGMRSIDWAKNHMPVLSLIKDRISREKPFKGLKIAACMHITKETAVLMLTLKDGGADIYLTASNPLSTQDDVAAALARSGVHVYGWRGESEEDYFKNIDIIISAEPDLVIDDGGDLIIRVHERYPDIARKIIGGCEETTTGVIREKALERDGKLVFPVIAVNNALTKRLMDNKFGTGQSTIQGLLNAASVLIAGKNFVVVGYGYVGSGIAKRAKGMGARTIIVEIDPIKALEAALDGFEVMSMNKAAEIGDIFVTATGNINVIRGEHIEKMRDGAILANSGHFNVEISIKDLESLSVSKRELNEFVEEYVLRNGKKIYLLTQGRLVNLVAAGGHPSDVMDVSFALQALSLEYILRNNDNLKPVVYEVPESIDREVAKLKLKAMNIELEVLTKEQEDYLKSYII